MEQRLIAYLTDIVDDRSLEKFCKDESIPVASAVRMMRRKDLRKEVGERLDDGVPLIAKALLLKSQFRRGNQGSAQAAKLFAEMAKLYTPTEKKIVEDNSFEKMTDDELDAEFQRRLQDMAAEKEGQEWRVGVN